MGTACQKPILGIESSCDELACAVLSADGRTVLSDEVHSQIEMHAHFGGIVPEVASRDHVRRLTFVLEQALRKAGVGIADLGGIAVTSGPGLIGSLLCGLEFAKGLALAAGLPIVGVHHHEGHLAAAFLGEEPPDGAFVALLVSGGHTSLIHVTALGGPYTVIGETRDDAAGEAFDKTAKFLGLGYPGGIVIDQLAADADAERFPFPDAMAGKNNFDFSFSGLKTAAIVLARAQPAPLEGQALRDFCASFQAAIVQNLLKKAFRAVRHHNVDQLVICGGVAANRQLRSQAAARAQRAGVKLVIPERRWCTDNAAMIARAGWTRLARGLTSEDTMKAQPYWKLA
ncbi:MAG: tRNA (adenosine(37)-N6)-threonylcarbamoyltransferase complex transferase subunit TsaD [Deltaproteobacteria bacterium]|nr:tRNA (adenosine(37)-N6)-threonylcarbamoyltransferase complex transferase subunit TsaD [Deltaproteobacteria bacterium]